MYLKQRLKPKTYCYYNKPFLPSEVISQLLSCFHKTEDLRHEITI